MRQKITLIVAIFLISALVLSACGGGQAELPAPPQNADSSGSPSVPEPAEANTSQDSAEEEPAPDEAAESSEQPASADEFAPLPAEPQPIQITSAGDRVLEGWYYPARVDNAPVVVLMHWAKGNMGDWQVIAPWLQNRLDEITVPQPGSEAYYDISWFPPMPEEISFAVVAFNFGNFGNSPFGGDRESWVWDAIGALNFASSLEGIDPHRISAIGASIGADGAVDSCYLFNDAGEMGTCIGALSLSPGNYLTENFIYPEAAEYIELSGFPVWCLAAENDYESPALCSVLVGEHAQGFIFAGGAHGMDLLTQDQVFLEPALPEDVNPMMVIQEFLEVAYRTPLNDFNIP
ncbi:MAG: hypothetical protein JW757_06060 [Anaerolineales bacterium]|nr:hypothetical protein [Anaerolineales bacterium]